jgi:hypothetical protein
MLRPLGLLNANGVSMGVASVETAPVELRGRKGSFVTTRCWVVSRIGPSQLKGRLSGCRGPIRPSGHLGCSATIFWSPFCACGLLL